MDPLTLTLAALAAGSLLLAALALLGGRGEARRLRAQAEEQARDLALAHTAAEVARAEAAGLGRRLEERDAAALALRQDLALSREAQEAARAAAAQAQSRAAEAAEAVKRLEGEAARRRVEEAQASERARALEEEHARLRAAHAALERAGRERDAAHEREVARLREIRKEMADEFRALAAATLRETGTQVGEQNKQGLNELLGPLKEQVGSFQAELRQVHGEAHAERARLGEQIRQLAEQARAVSQDAANLAQALKGDKQRQGAWGEAQLERYLELMGFRRDVDYEVQSSRTGEEGDRLRPDVVLRLPGDKALVIDSKVSLSAYADAIAAEDPQERERCLRLHARNVRARVDELAARDYHRHVDGSMDWVLLFMPVEGAVSAAWAEDAEVAAYAMERGVALAYPTTLLLALRTVRHLWDGEKRNRNAEAIAERAGRLHDKLAGFLESFEAVGRALESAQGAHEKARGQLVRGNGNLVRQVEQLRELGARTGRTLALAGESEEEAGGPRILGLPDAAGEAAPTHPPADGVPPAE